MDGEMYGVPSTCKGVTNVDTNKSQETKANKPAPMTKEKAAMYRNALPKVIRENVLKRKINPRDVYREYRKFGRDVVIAKYSTHEENTSQH